MLLLYSGLDLGPCQNGLHVLAAAAHAELAELVVAPTPAVLALVGLGGVVED